MKLLLHGLLACVLASSARAQMDLRLDIEPTTADIGQPVTLILTAEHVPSFEVELPKSVLPDDSWMLYEDAKKVTLPHPNRDGMSLTVVRWEIASLDSGERAIEFPDVRWSDGNSAGLTEVEAPKLNVYATLVEGEDEARPALMFREPTFAEPRIRNWPWVVGALAGVVLLAVLLRFKRKAKPTEKLALSPRESLAALESRSGELGIRATYFELSRLVRSALDEGGTDCAGLTDEEWLAVRETDARSSKEECEALAALFERCQEVKYAQAEPTRWALEEALATAQQRANGARTEQPEVAA